MLLNDEPVGHLLRGSEATQAASYVAQIPAIREKLVAAQQRIGMERPDLVTEGRDQGTVVFPDAELKFYLDATPQERARRRVAQLRARGEATDYQDILNQIIARDKRDAARAVGPLAVPRDARVLDTTLLTQQQVIDSILASAEGAMASPKATARSACPERAERARVPNEQGARERRTFRPACAQRSLEGCTGPVPGVDNALLRPQGLRLGPGAA